MVRLVLSALVFTSLGCSAFGYGTAPKAVRSASSSSTAAAGTHADVDQAGTRLRVRAVHLCDVSTHEERTAGALAEKFHPQAELDAARREKDRDVSHLGPLTEGILRGSDESGIQQRSLGGELHRSLTSPWLLGAVAGGAVETIMVATSRVEGKLDGELHRKDGVQRAVPCRQNPYEGARVEISVGGRALALGTTGEDGSLSLDLVDALEVVPEEETRGEVTADVLVEGKRAGDVVLAPVLHELGLRAERRAVKTCAEGDCSALAERRVRRPRND